MDAGRPTDEQVFRLIYRSRSLIPAEERPAALGLLFTDARGRNKRMGVSGALLVSEDSFVQALEGDERAVRTLFDRIEGDTRHTAVEVIEQGPVDGRVFARWAMAKIAEEGDPDLPLIAHASKGVAPAAPRGATTPEQESVLEAMREAGRSAAVRPA